MPVNVVYYNPEWVLLFKELREPIWEKIRDYAVDVIHVGSTSVEGMSAKPVIDIDVLVEDWECFPVIVRRLRELGYEYQGDLGINEREAFKPTSEPRYPHHLYVCRLGSVAYKNHVLLRKHLMENADAFRRYKELKVRLGGAALGIDEYTRLKSELILEFLSVEGLPDEELDAIRKENLS
jgi:GrpB-like predicted nucleotidyltransferase (UPF0157 family)